jgi:hypothetical protein
MLTHSEAHGRLDSTHDVRLWIRCKYLEQQNRELESRHERLLQAQDEVAWKHRELLATHQRHVAGLEQRVARLALAMDEWKGDLARVVGTLEALGTRARR